MTQEIHVTPNLDLDPWTDLLGDGSFRQTGVTAKVTRVGLLPDGTKAQRATVVLLIELPSGTQLLAEMTWRLWQQVTSVLVATPVAQMEEL